MSQYQRKRQGLNNAFTNILLINACSASLGSGLLPMRSSIMHTHAHTRTHSLNKSWRDSTHTSQRVHVIPHAICNWHITSFWRLNYVSIFISVHPSIHLDLFLIAHIHQTINYRTFQLEGLITSHVPTAIWQFLWHLLSSGTNWLITCDGDPFKNTVILRETTLTTQKSCLFYFILLLILDKKVK